jgi:hypothetical protein
MTQSDQMSNVGGNNYNINNKEQSEISSNNNKKRTIKDSELDHEELIINDSGNDTLNFNFNSKNNNFMTTNEENQMNDYKKIYDKEVTNKIQYELEQDLINKQKENYSKRLLSGKKRKFEKNHSEITIENKRNKLTLLDLETQTDKKIKEIENLLKGGVTDTKLQQLEIQYKDNKDIMGVIYKYKTKKYNLENSNNINNTNVNFNDSNNNSIQIVNMNKYNNNSKKNRSLMKEYSDLSPFYYISNGNKVSKSMWGYNDKIKYKNARNNYNNLNNNINPNEKIGLTKEEIIQNKLKIFKDKIYKPFWEKVEKEKKNEYKRIQILKKITDPTIRENLETKFAKERGKIDLELTQEKDRINKAIKDYENNLLLGENIKNPSSKSNIFFE